MGDTSRRGWAQLAGAVAGLLYVGLLLLEESGRGFPDGHLTALDRALHVPRIAAALLAVALAAWLLRRSPRTRWVALGLLVGVVLVERIGFPMIGGWLGLESGQGG